MSESQHELCPRCHDGVLYQVTDREDSYGVRCAQCDYHESRVKPGYEVVEPGAPITPAAQGQESKGGDR